MSLVPFALAPHYLPRRVQPCWAHCRNGIFTASVDCVLWIFPFLSIIPELSEILQEFALLQSSFIERTSMHFGFTSGFTIKDFTGKHLSAHWQEVLQGMQVSHATMTPTQWALRAAGDLPSLKHLWLGGSKAVGTGRTAMILEFDEGVAQFIHSLLIPSQVQPSLIRTLCGEPMRKDTIDIWANALALRNMYGETRLKFGCLLLIWAMHGWAFWVTCRGRGLGSVKTLKSWFFFALRVSWLHALWLVNAWTQVTEATGVQTFHRMQPKDPPKLVGKALPGYVVAMTEAAWPDREWEALGQMLHVEFWQIFLGVSVPALVKSCWNPKWLVAQEGEVLVAGKGLARGYLGLPEAQKVVIHRMWRIELWSKQGWCCKVVFLFHAL